MTFPRIAGALSIVVLVAGPPTLAMAEKNKSDEVTFTKEILDNPEYIARGKEVWNEQCKLCHGKAAYPGKAPKLKPYKYKPEFVYRRVTKGFRGMPSWKDVFDKRARMGVTAFVMSKDFSN